MIDRENLKAYVDGELTGAEAEDIRLEIDADPVLRGEVDQMRAIGNILRQEIRPVEVVGKEATLALIARKTRRPWFRSAGFLSLAATAAAGGGIFFAWKSLSPNSTAADSAAIATVAAMSPKEAESMPEKAVMKSPAVVAPMVPQIQRSEHARDVAPSVPAPKSSFGFPRGAAGGIVKNLTKPAAPSLNSKLNTVAEAPSKKRDDKFDASNSSGGAELALKPSTTNSALKSPSVLSSATKEEVVKLERTPNGTTEAVRKLIKSADAKVVSEATSQDKQVFVIEVDSDKAGRLLDGLRSIGDDHKAETRPVAAGGEPGASTAKAKMSAGAGGAASDHARASSLSDVARAKKRTIRIEIPIIHPGKGPDKSE